MLGIRSSTKAPEMNNRLRLRIAFARTGDQTYHFHLLPSGLISTNTDALIGTGVVFNVEAFFKELAELESKGVSRVHERIHVSSRCHLNFALHAAVDGLSEEELGANQIGTVRIFPSAFSCYPESQEEQKGPHSQTCYATQIH